MINYTIKAIGTHRNIDFVSSSQGSSKILSLLDELFQNFENRYSRFNDNSLVSQLNTNKILESNDYDFIKMIQLGIDYQRKSMGYFSLFIGSALEKLGYGKSNDNGSTLGEGEIKSLGDIIIQTPDIVVSMIEKDRYRIILLSNNHIDLGGLGKGYLIHLIKNIFEEYRIDTYRINGGGDIAIKQETIDIFGNIILQNPLNEIESIGEVCILDGAICGSGALYRHRNIKDSDSSTNHAHHLIDPYTNKPSQTSLVGVFTKHPDIIIADIAATALFVAPESTIEEIAKNMDIDCMLIFDDLSSIRTEGFVIQ